MMTAQQQAAIAQQMGLPADAPLGAIDAFLKLSQVDKGKGKAGKVDTETRRAAEKAVIDFMKARNLTFLQIQDRYLVYKTEPKQEGWSDELVLKAFIAFHQRNMNQGPLDVVATNFLEFCKSARKTGEVNEVLSLQKKRPLCATLSMLTSMGTL